MQRRGRAVERALLFLVAVGSSLFVFIHLFAPEASCLHGTCITVRTPTAALEQRRVLQGLRPDDTVAANPILTPSPSSLFSNEEALARLFPLIGCENVRCSENGVCFARAATHVPSLETFSAHSLHLPGFSINCTRASPSHVLFPQAQGIAGDKKQVKNRETTGKEEQQHSQIVSHSTHTPPQASQPCTTWDDIPTVFISPNVADHDALLGSALLLFEFMENFGWRNGSGGLVGPWRIHLLAPTAPKSMFAEAFSLLFHVPITSGAAPCARHTLLLLDLPDIWTRVPRTTIALFSRTLSSAALHARARPAGASVTVLQAQTNPAIDTAVPPIQDDTMVMLVTHGAARRAGLIVSAMPNSYMTLSSYVNLIATSATVVASGPSLAPLFMLSDEARFILIDSDSPDTMLASTTTQITTASTLALAAACGLTVERIHTSPDATTLQARISAVLDMLAKPLLPRAPAAHETSIPVSTSTPTSTTSTTLPYPHTCLLPPGPLPDADKWIASQLALLPRNSQILTPATWARLALTGRLSTHIARDQSASPMLDGCFGLTWPRTHRVCGKAAAHKLSSPLLSPAGRAARRRTVIDCISNPATDSTFCDARNLVLHADRVTVAQGNETIASVHGRPEEQELPVYTAGAWAGSDPLRVDLTPFSSEASSSSAITTAPTGLLAGSSAGLTESTYITQVLRSYHVATDAVDRCNEMGWEDRVTLAITRVDYANLFHTMRDVFNVYHTLLLLGLATRATPAAEIRSKFDILFLDGHAQGALDEIWTQVFGRVRYVSAHRSKARTCFGRIIFVHPGEKSVLHSDAAECGHGAAAPLASAFARTVLDAFNVTDEPMTNTALLVGRRPYVAHPRAPLVPGPVSRSIFNEDEILQAVHAARPDITTELALMTPGSMDFAAQLRAVRRARVLVAFHGAALAHLLFVHPDAAVLELTSMAYWSRSHFSSLARNSNTTFMLMVVSAVGEQARLDPQPIVQAVDALAPRPGWQRPCPVHEMRQ
eukprot:m.124490 g.124490  ORF g.124490 m.124490 type:complete len:1003 (-) comp14651_c0_seq2:75-3083(-)